MNPYTYGFLQILHLPLCKCDKTISSLTIVHNVTCMSKVVEEKLECGKDDHIRTRR